LEVEDNPYRIPDLLPDEYHELFSEYENFFEWCHKDMTPKQLEVSGRVLEKLRQADKDHVCLDEVDHTTQGTQENQFSRDDVARMIATTLNTVFGKLNPPQIIQGIAVLPAGKGGYLIDVVIWDFATESTWGVYVIIQRAEEETNGRT
jgi:hypothetical protein